MKTKLKYAAAALLCTAAVAFVTGCALEDSPYELNNEENYTVSVKYDANGGSFTTNTTVIVDSYNLSEMKTNSEGLCEIALLAPEDESRTEPFTPKRNGYFFAGWYEGREKADKDSDAEYAYSGKWDFEEDRLCADPEKEYSADTPEKTFYAAWIPLFEIRVHDANTNDKISTVLFDPREKTEFALPSWNEETGCLDMNDIPERKEFTFEKAYLDADMKKALEGDTLLHPGTFDPENATTENAVLDLYVTWKEGQWYRISTAEQFIENASVGASYEILADLDFEGLIWPTALTFNDYKGQIVGNGHTVKNITFNQTANDKSNIGIFGNLTESVKISDLTFENITLCLKKGTRINTNFGILAGSISQNAALTNVKLVNSTLQIDSDCYFGSNNFAVGLVCGMGNADAVEAQGLKAEKVGADPDKYVVTVDGNTVTVVLSSSVEAE